MKNNFPHIFISAFICACCLFYSPPNASAQSGEVSSTDASSLRLKLSTQHADQLKVIAVYESYAYVGSENAINIYDISNSQIIERVGLVGMPHSVNVLVERDGHLFVAHGDYMAASSATGGLVGYNNLGGLMIMELSNPLVPTVVANVPSGNAFAVHIADSYILLLTRGYTNGIQDSYTFYDISDLPTITQISAFEQPFTFDFVEIQDRLLTLVNDGNTTALNGLNLTDASQPAQTLNYSLDGYGNAIESIGNQGLLLQASRWGSTAQQTSGLISLDATTPDQPIETARSLFNIHSGQLAVSEDRAYVAGILRDEEDYSAAEYSIRSFDLSDPSRPIQTSYLPQTSAVDDMAITEEGLALIQQTKLHLYDHTSPGILSSSAVYTTSDIFDGLAAIAPLDDENWLMVNADGLNVVSNVQSLANPAVIGQTSAPTKTIQMAIRNQYAYLINQANPSIPIYDLANPSLPTLAGELTVNAGNPAFTHTVEIMAFSGTSAWVGYYTEEGSSEEATAHVAEYDLSNPLAPILLHTFSVGSFHPLESAGVHDIAFAPNHDYAYIRTNDAVYIYNIQVKGQPSQVTVVNEPSIATCRATIVENWYGPTVCHIAVKNTLLYISQERTLTILDIQNPAEPVVVGHYGDAPTRDESSNLQSAGLNAIDDMAVFEDTLILYDRGYASGVGRFRTTVLGTVQVVSINHPTTPHLLAESRLPYGRRGVPIVWQDELNEFIRLTELHMIKDRLFVANFDQILGFDMVNAIKGKVADAYGTTYPDLTIQNANQPSVQTDSAGSFQFDSLPSGTYTLSTAVNGFRVVPPELVVSLPNNADTQQFYVLPEPASILLPSEPANTSSQLSYMDTRNLATSLQLSSDAVEQNTMITISATVHEGPTGQPMTANAFEIEASVDGSLQPSVTFNEPLTVTINYADQTADVLDNESQLTLWYLDDNRWIEAADTCIDSTKQQIDLDQNQIMVPICQRGLYVLAGPPLNYVFLPALLSQ